MERWSLWTALAVVGAVLAVTGCSGGSGDTESSGDSGGSAGSGDSGGAETAPPELFVVGDSLSDTGNSAAFADYLLGQPMYPEASMGLCHPGERWLLDRDCTDVLYRRSRVSNGPVAVEHLAAHLGIEPFDPSFHTVPDRPAVGRNYAVAGAKVRGTTPRDLAHQLDRLLLDHGPLLPSGAAVVLMIGGNDAIDALQAAALPGIEDPTDALAEPMEPPDAQPEDAPPAEPAVIVSGAVDGIVDAAGRLLDSGACVVVANVPNLATLPAVRTTAELEGIDLTTAFTTAEQVSTSFNTSLAERLSELAATHASGTSLVQFDLAAHFEAARAAADAAGTNVTDACFDSEAYIGSETGERRFHPDCAPAEGEAPKFDGFFFWDGIHPAGAAHAAVGAALVETYEAGCR